jgi:glycosyltransferase involved in cell wall biosynthesis
MLDDLYNKTIKISWKETIVVNNKYSIDYIKTNISKQYDVVQIHSVIKESDIIVEDKDEEQYILLSNSNPRKGVELFDRIANQLPDKNFLRVGNFYAGPDSETKSKNIKVTDFIYPVNKLLSSVRILLLPSITESFARIAFEAMYNGIPVIYTRPYSSFNGISYESMEGVEEWIGDAAIQCSMGVVDEWCDAVSSLDDPNTYAHWSDKAKTKTRQSQILTAIDRYEALLYETYTQS